MINSILVVCVGNICRSPTAEALLKSKLADSQIQVSSAGLGALVGKPLEATATQILEGAGYSLPGHEARQITASLLHGADLILVMEKRHLNSITAMSPESRGKTFLIGKWLDELEVPDPYRQHREAFEHVYQLLDRSVNAWLPYLK